ncbi:hypothetical protein AVEN_118458-1 [Araneus ventricosus]|uniref:Uncharacterized protein n=1 Tax=Araneus ventricosus TaxID=182803 RepID=A0A4Y2TRF1_ARAVE|nr:hypothetical protein AVEN_118458-1 [Araneus ventricosus]
MIFVDESQRDLLRIVWKESIDVSIKTYKMNRVVYGTTCAPYLAQRVLKQLVMDDGHNYPLAASAGPLGLISPVVTKAKLVMQELWRLKLDWNDSLPIQLDSQWKRFVAFLSTINTPNIPQYFVGVCSENRTAWLRRCFRKGIRCSNISKVIAQEKYLQIYCVQNQESHL